jgi:cytochrome c oxidase cbb3-type subunit 3
MSVKERDPLTGHQTTGHEWNGITELNTRVPRPVWFFIGATAIWSLVVWILLPAWPLGRTYTPGILGADQQKRVEAQVAAANVARSDWADAIEAKSVGEILADPALMRHVEEAGPALFGDNCAACHGQHATGSPGFPDLVDGDWLWGGDPDTVLETIRVGVNSSHPDTRTSQMLAFGRDGMLKTDEIRTVVEYVKSLSGEAADPAAVTAGASLFADNCASCHGDDGKGNQELGAPNLTDSTWLYGGDEATLLRTVHYGRQGLMPTWEHRLTEVDRKILASYVLELGRKGKP